MIAHEGARPRLASVADAESLARMLHDFNTEFDTETDPVDVLAARFARILAHEAVFAVLVEDGVRPAGFALVTLRPAIWFDGPVATLDELYVVPERRGGGLGTALLEVVRAETVRRDCPEMHINVDEVDADARRFYERHGFTNTESDPDDRMLLYVGPTSLEARD